MSTRGIETLGFRESRTIGFGRRCAIIALSLACAAFTYRVTVDVLQWRNTPTSHARDVLGNRSASERQRIDAAVIMTNDALDSVTALHALADRQDAIGAEVRNLLDQIANRAKR